MSFINSRWIFPVIMIIACGCMGVALAAAPRSYFLSPDGKDTNAGTVQAPFRTFAKAVATARAGDTVIIGGGTYKSRLEITRSGAPGAYITYKGESGSPPVIDAAGQLQGVMIWGASYIRVQGIVVRNSKRSGIHIHDHLGDSDTGSDDNIIQDNTITDCGQEGQNGIYVGGHRNHIEGNIVRHNGHHPEALEKSGHGIYILGNGNVVAGNTVTRSGRVGIRMEGNDNRVEQNRIAENRDFGLTIWVDAPLQCRNTLISENTIENNRRGGISVYGQGSGGTPEQIRISQNRLYHENAEYGIRLLDTVRDTLVSGNRIAGHYADSFLYVEKDAANAFSETGNCFCGSGSFYYLDKRYADFDTYRSATGQGAGSCYRTSAGHADCE